MGAIQKLKKHLDDYGKLFNWTDFKKQCMNEQVESSAKTGAGERRSTYVAEIQPYWNKLIFNVTIRAVKN